MKEWKCSKCGTLNKEKVEDLTNNELEDRYLLYNREIENRIFEEVEK